MEDDPNLILAIRGAPGDAAKCLKLPHNRVRYSALPEYLRRPPPDPRSRSCSPNSDSDGDNQGDNSAEPPPDGGLLLTFDKAPTDFTRGFTFGTSKSRCDVFLASTRATDISSVHFVITLDKTGHLVLRDVSSRETAVSYGGWGEQHQRRGFQWILDLNDKRMGISVHLRNGFRLDITLPSHVSCQNQYKANVDAYKHVVEFVCYTEDPFHIVMEYMPLASLRFQDSIKPIRTTEVQLVLAQGLDALRFMHSKGVTHRDIKPENFLANNRSGPFIIKLADFGLSKFGSSERIRVDIWALGVVALEFIYYVPCVKSGYGTQRIADVAKEAFCSNLDSPFYFMLSRMLEIDPNNRPTTEDYFEGEPTVDFSIKYSGGTSGLTTPTNNRSVSAQTSRVSASADILRQIPAGSMQRPMPKRHLSSTSSRGHRTTRLDRQYLTISDSRR
ncbi:serine/threonine protein kinase [Blastomyces percursus]|uniref:non-specific serine/threonine protein kinase n=1 Tax=Blastomyces percursus TaxID=1658174 RepID=A0A1J9QYW4_9EURO|nr:serine/threonine protein kinase [Blastomyces percursus]